MQRVKHYVVRALYGDDFHRNLSPLVIQGGYTTV